jgi:hypothetical protein
MWKDRQVRVKCRHALCMCVRRQRSERRETHPGQRKKELSSSKAM